MADSKPGTLAKLQTGKLIDTCKHFVATMNWVISCLSNIKGKNGIKITGIDKGEPQIELDSKSLGYVEVITGATIKDGVITFTKQQVKVVEKGKTSTDTLEVQARGETISVLVGSEYNSNHQLVAKYKSVEVIAASEGESERVVFTAEPLSGV